MGRVVAGQSPMEKARVDESNEMDIKDRRSNKHQGFCHGHDSSRSTCMSSFRFVFLPSLPPFLIFLSTTAPRTRITTVSSPVPRLARHTTILRVTVEALVLVEGKVLAIVTEDLRGHQAQTREGLAPQTRSGAVSLAWKTALAFRGRIGLGWPCVCAGLGCLFGVLLVRWMHLSDYLILVFSCS